MSVIVYSKPGCGQCVATTRKLDKDKVVYDKVDVSLDPEALQRVLELGYSQVPVIVTDDDHWYGFQPDKLDELKLAA